MTGAEVSGQARGDDGTERRADAGTTPSQLPLRILEVLLSKNGPCGVTELAEELGLPKARVHRHLAGLRQAGYLSQRDRRYEVGWRLVLLGQQIESQSRLVTLARPVMTRLRDAIAQTIVLSQLTDAGVTVTEVLRGGSPIDVILGVGTQFGYNSTAQGKVALAFASPQQLDTWSRLIDEQRTPETVTDHDVLWEQVARVREQGWASAPEETYRGVNAVAAPVFGHDREIACTLAIIASTHLVPDPPPDPIVAALTEAARELSAELGYGHDLTS